MSIARDDGATPDGQEIHDRLRASEARYRAIFDNAQVSVWEQDLSEMVVYLDALRARGVTDLRAHLELNPDCLWETVARRRTTEINAYTLSLFEAEDEDSLLRDLNSVFLPETEQLLRDELVALWQGQRRFRRETAVRSLKGRRLDVVVNIAYEGVDASRSIVVVHDITERKASELAAQRLAAIVESSQDAILSKNLDGIITSWNAGAERLLGYTAQEAVGQPVTMLMPADRRNEEDIILASIRSGRAVEHYDTVRQRKDGSLVDISLTVSPVMARDGTIAGASSVARDITERIEAQEQQLLLLREMNHRVKNLLTLSGGVVSLSARYAQTPEDLAAAVQQRLNALARAHEMILPDTGAAAGEAERSTTLHALIRTIVSPYDSPAGDATQRIELRGADAEISGRAVTSFALLLHEFATNAAKHGALSTAEGRIEIDCAEDGDDFVILWQERGGPPVGASHENGFGDVLSRATVQGQLKGELSREAHPEGLTIRLAAPRERLTE